MAVLKSLRMQKSVKCTTQRSCSFLKIVLFSKTDEHTNVLVGVKGENTNKEEDVVIQTHP